jgi:hypothetical protein
MGILLNVFIIHNYKDNNVLKLLLFISYINTKNN